VEGIQWQRLNGSHRDAIAALARRSDIADGAGGADTTAGLLAGRTPRYVGIGAFATGLLVAAVEINKAGRLALIEGHVDPGYRGRGLGAAMLDWALDEAGTSPASVKTGSLTDSKQRLFESRGLRACAAVEHLSMPLDPPVEPTPLPPGIAVTGWDAQDGYRLYTETFTGVYTETFAGLSNPFALSEEPGSSYEDWLEETMEDFVESCSLVARTTDGTPVGFITNDEAGPVQIGVIGTWRRQGLGQALVTWSMARLHDFTERAELAEVSVDANNVAAVQLFRSTGFRQEGRTTYFEQVH
jgi:ribosomal protein S18 acetylase RimI-like enzyme